MGKKRNTARKGTANSHQNSFQQSITNALNQVIPKVKEEIFKAVGDHLKYLDNRFLSAFAKVSNRLTAVERVLQLDSEALQEEVYKVEDEATGYRLVNRAVEKGDLVRMSYRFKEKEADKFPVDTADVIVEGVNEGKNSLPEGIEPEIVGMNVGETKEVAFTQQDEKEYVMEVTVNRVSELVNPKTENNEGDNESENGK